MSTVIIAVAMLGVSASWVWFDRSLVRAVFVALGLALVMTGISTFISELDSISSMMLDAGTALTFAGVGVAAATVIKRATAGGGTNLYMEPSTQAHNNEPIRDKADAETASELRRNMQNAIQEQRDKTDRLVAGNVQLLDLGKYFEENTEQSVMSRAEVMQVAETIAQSFLKPADVMIHAGEDGLIFLFDGLRLDEAEVQSRAIADAISEALGRSDKSAPFMAKGFAHELDDYMDGAIIDTVDDLIRVVKLAHQAFIQRERSLAKDLDRYLTLETQPILRPGNLDVFGYEVQVQKINSDGGRRETLTFSTLQPPYGSEIDCAMVMKLAAEVRSLEFVMDQVVILPIRFETVTHPLYLDNLMHCLRQLPDRLRVRLVCNLIVDKTSAPPRLDQAIKVLNKVCKGVLLHVSHPFTDIDRTKQFGADGLTLSSDQFDLTNDPQDLVEVVRSARQAKLFTVLLGIPNNIKIVHELKVPYSNSV